nr:hypothetical protein [uncultured Actinomyces sp.]
MRYTRQLATAALVVAAGLGMGACSAHPGAAIVTSSGATYSNADIHEAASQINVLAGGQQTYSDGEIRAKLMNQDAYAAGAAVAGITVTDEMINMINQDAAAAHNAAPLELTPTTRDALTALILDVQLRGQKQMNPAAATAINSAMNEASAASGMTLNPRFPVSSVNGQPPLFGDAVAGPQDPDPSALMGGGQTGTRTQ